MQSSPTRTCVSLPLSPSHSSVVTLLLLLLLLLNSHFILQSTQTHNRSIGAHHNVYVPDDNISPIINLCLGPCSKLKGNSHTSKREKRTSSFLFITESVIDLLSHDIPCKFHALVGPMVPCKCDQTL